MPSDYPTGNLALFDAFRRRRWLGVTVFAWTLGAVAGAVAFLPNVYRASAKVMAERGGAGVAQTDPAATTELQTRIQTISQEMLSRARLESLIGQFDLYPQIRGRGPIEKAVERMQSDIKIDVKEPDPSDTRPDAVSFSLSYTSTDPLVAALVANRLAASYVEEDEQIRNQQAHRAAQVLSAQLDQVKQRLDEQDRRASAFLQTHTGELPEQTAANLAALERLSTEFRINSDQQQKALEQRAALMHDPIAARQPAVPIAGDEGGRSLSDLKHELAALQARYTERHPDVRRVEQEIARVEKGPLESPAGSGAAASTAGAGSTALGGVERNLRHLSTEQQSLKRQMEAYQSRVERSPQVEQEIKQRSRDSGTMVELYYSLLKQYEDARLAEDVDHRPAGERFRILDSALPPTSPAAPNRSQLLVLGVVLALALASASILLVDQLDSSFHSVDDLKAFTGVPVLTAIPPIVTSRDAMRRRWRVGLAVAGTVCLLLLTVIATRHLAGGNVQLVRLLSRGKV